MYVLQPLALKVRVEPPPVPDNNKKPTSHINKKPSFGRKGFCP